MDRELCYKLNKLIDEVASKFAEKYFSDASKVSMFFVEDSFSDELNYNIFINDYYFSLQDMYHALRYDIPWEVIDERYEKSTAVINWKTILQERVNLKNFYLLNYKEWKKLENTENGNGK